MAVQALHLLLLIVKGKSPSAIADLHSVLDPVFIVQSRLENYKSSGGPLRLRTKLSASPRRLRHGPL